MVKRGFFTIKNSDPDEKFESISRGDLAKILPFLYYSIFAWKSFRLFPKPLTPDTLQLVWETLDEEEQTFFTDLAEEIFDIVKGL